MEENELDFNGLEDLMPKIEEAIKDSKHREKEIELNETFLKEETRLGYYEEGKAKIEEMKAQKEEMDEMTKPHLNRAKLAIDRLKEEERVDFNNKMIQIAEKRQEAEKKCAEKYEKKREEIKGKYARMLLRAKGKENSDDMAEEAYKNGLEKITADETTEKDKIKGEIDKEKEFHETFYEDTMNKLNKWDEFIIDSLHEFGMPIPTASKTSRDTKQKQGSQTIQETKEGEKEQKINQATQDEMQAGYDEWQKSAWGDEEQEEGQEGKEEIDQASQEEMQAGYDEWQRIAWGDEEQEEPESVESSQENGASAGTEEEDNEAEKVEEIQKKLEGKLAEEVQAMKEGNGFKAPAEIKEEEKQVTEKKQGIFSKIKNWFKDKINKLLPKRKNNQQQGENSSKETEDGSNDHRREEMMNALKAEVINGNNNQQKNPSGEKQNVKGESEGMEPGE